MRNHFILLFLMAVCLGCGQKKSEIIHIINDNPNKYDSTYQMVKTGEISIPLDSITAPDAESICFKKMENGRNSIAFLNSMTGAIYVYDFEKLKLLKVIKPKKNGVAGVGKIMGFYWHSRDSIFVYDDWKGKISLLNDSGKVTENFHLNIVGKKNHLFPSIQLSSHQVWRLKNNDLTMSGISMGEYDFENETNRPLMLMFNLKSQQKQFFQKYSPIYTGANWGGLNYRTGFTAFNNKNEVIASFAADHYIEKTNLEDFKTERFYAGSRYIDTISSLGLPKSETMKKENRNTVENHYWNNHSYSTIIFDEYRNMYYRIAEIGIEADEKKEQGRSVKQFSIIILDENGKKVGETLLPKRSHSRLTFFVTSSGLHLKKYSADEDHFIFSVFTPVKND